MNWWLMLLVLSLGIVNVAMGIEFTNIAQAVLGFFVSVISIVFYYG